MLFKDERKRRANDHSAEASALSAPPNTTGATAILEALGDGVIGVNIDGRITYINPTAAEIIGCEVTAALHKPLSSVFRLRGDTLYQLEPAFIQTILRDKQIYGPVTSRHLLNDQQQEISVNYSISPINDVTAVILFHTFSYDEPNKTNLLYQASFDQLTGLPNRLTLHHTLNQLHHDSQAHANQYSLLLLDFDRFKLINDCYGHFAGDALLKDGAAVMTQHVRDEDSMGRWGGEEFIGLLPETGKAVAIEIAERLREKVADINVSVHGRQLSTTISIGIATFPDDGDDVDSLLRTADVALYEAKRAGRNRTFTSEQVSGNIFSIATRLEDALNEGRVSAAHQPIFDLQSGQRVAEEALARIVCRDQGILPAASFIEAAEQLQMAHRIDHQLISQTILRCSSNALAGGATIDHFVNISADLLRHADLVKSILDLSIEQCNKCGSLVGDTKPLVIEITERELLGNVKEAKRQLAPFLDFGLRLAIDDFGSGYSSLQYIADLPITFLKIEGELIKRAPYEQRVRAILQGVQSMASNLGLTTIAEYIEDERTLDVIREIGIHWGQGNYLGEPELENTNLNFISVPTPS